MGYLNNASVTVDAILTTKGRELLSKGSTNGLNIKYFALGDDEVDYDLWNPSHPLGSDYYGIVIENMPVLEASPIPEQNLKSKLITLPKSTTRLTTINPITIPTGTFTINLSTGGSGAFPFYQNQGANGIEAQISLSDGSTGNSNLGYTIYYDSRYIKITPQIASNFSNLGQLIGGANSATTSIGDSGVALSSIISTNNFRINVIPSAVYTDFNGNATTLNIFVQGNELGGKITVPVPIGVR
jgi:hypothetical protein